MASALTVPERGLVLRQETTFPDEERTKLTVTLADPATFTLYLRHPSWVAAGAFAVKVNGQAVPVQSTPSSYAAVSRQWNNGDVVEIELPMRTTVQQLPDNSPWYAIMRGPILLAYPSSTENLDGLFAAPGSHIANGPLVSMDKMPALLATAAELPSHIVPDPASGSLHFRLKDVAYPGSSAGMPLMPFFRLHESRYQMYWETVDQLSLASRQENLALAEAVNLARDAATLDMVAIGEQQSETSHSYVGVNSATGIRDGVRWRDGTSIQYTLDTHGEPAVDLVVTYWGGDSGRIFDVFANDTLLATQVLENQRPGLFMERRCVIPPSVLSAAANGLVNIRFVATQYLAGGIYGLRLMKPDASAPPIARLEFDESTGTSAVDSAGNNWDGTLVNGAAWAASANGNAVSLDGVDDHVTLPNGVVAGLTHCTISAWVKASSVGAWSRIFDFGTGADNFMFLTPKNGWNGAVRFSIRTPATGEQIIDGNATLPVGAWTHVAVTLKGSVGTLYVNGVAVGANTSMTLTPSMLGVTTQNYIGKSQFADPYFNGLVDDFRIYNPALSAADIAAMASAPVAPLGVSAGAGDAKVTLNWNAVAGTIDYKIGRATVAGGPYTTIVSGISAATSFLDFGLTNGTTYYYTVTAANGAGESAKSSEVSATPLVPPSATSNVSATGAGASIVLGWNAVSYADTYTVKRSSTSGGPLTIVAAGITGTSYSDTGLTNGATYYYVVSAVNAAGEGTNSTEVSSVPLAPITAEEKQSPKIAIAGGSAGVTVKSSVIGHLYQLQYRDNLSSGSWLDYETAQAGTGADLTLTMPAVSPIDRRFFRVLIKQ